MRLFFSEYWVPVLVVMYFTFSLLHSSHMISAGTPTGRGNPTKLMFINLKIDLCWCKFLWQVEWPEYLYENLSKVSIRLMWSEPTVCMCIFPCKSYCDHNTMCRVYLSMRLLWSEVHTSLHAMCKLQDWLIVIRGTHITARYV
jgi:hypothetical protein